MALVVAVSAACTGGDGETSPVRETARAEIDVETGAIRLPLDRYSLSVTEEGVFATANDLAYARCMAEAGFADAFPFVDRRNPQEPSDRRYGVWMRAEVARYGYGDPPTSARGKLLRELNTKPMSPRAQAALLACRATVQKLGLLLPEPREDEQLVPVDNAGEPLDSDEAKQVIGQWQDCLRSRGVAPPSRQDGWIPERWTALPLEEQIRVGLIDVDCKEQHDVVRRLADLEASYQQPVVTRNEALLTQQRQALDALLAASRAYIAGAPELIDG